MMIGKTPETNIETTSGHVGPIFDIKFELVRCFETNINS